MVTVLILSEGACYEHKKTRALARVLYFADGLMLLSGNRRPALYRAQWMRLVVVALPDESCESCIKPQNENCESEYAFSGT